MALWADVVKELSLYRQIWGGVHHFSAMRMGVQNAAKIELLQPTNSSSKQLPLILIENASKTE